MKEWKNYIMPVLMMLLSALVGFMINSITDDVKDNKVHIEKKIDKDRFKEYKADNDRKFEAIFRMIGELRR